MAFNRDTSLFGVAPLIYRLISTAVILGIYFYIIAHSLFPDYQIYIYYAVKILIAYQILAGSVRTLLVPFAGLLIGALLIFSDQFYGIDFISVADTMQLLIVSGVGAIVTLLAKL